MLLGILLYLQRMFALAHAVSTSHFLQWWLQR